MWSRFALAFSTRRRTSRDEHAAHRPPVHTRAPLAAPPIAFGVLYPRQDVMAVIDDVQRAHEAEAALHAAGIPAHDSDVLEPSFVLDGLRQIDRRRGRLGRLAAALSEFVSDDCAYMRGYQAEAEHGHALVVVHASTASVVEQVRSVLRAHGAHAMRHYGRFAVTELF